MKILGVLIPAVAATLVAPAPSAHAASLCAGSRIEHIPIGQATAPVGYLDVFFDAATGNNCAVTMSTGALDGQAKYMYVELVRCKETDPATFCTFDQVAEDGGSYKNYAGPVSVYAPSNCIFAFGEIHVGPVKLTADTGRATGKMASHC